MRAAKTAIDGISRRDLSDYLAGDMSENVAAKFKRRGIKVRRVETSSSSDEDSSNDDAGDGASTHWLLLKGFKGVDAAGRHLVIHVEYPEPTIRMGTTSAKRLAKAIVALSGMPERATGVFFEIDVVAVDPIARYDYPFVHPQANWYLVQKGLGNGFDYKRHGGPEDGANVRARPRADARFFVWDTRRVVGAGVVPLNFALAKHKAKLSFDWPLDAEGKKPDMRFGFLEKDTLTYNEGSYTDAEALEDVIELMVYQVGTGASDAAERRERGVRAHPEDGLNALRHGILKPIKDLVDLHPDYKGDSESKFSHKSASAAMSDSDERAFPKPLDTFFGRQGEKVKTTWFNRANLFWVGSDRPKPGYKITKIADDTARELLHDKIDEAPSLGDAQARAKRHKGAAETFTVAAV